MLRGNFCENRECGKPCPLNTLVCSFCFKKYCCNYCIDTHIVEHFKEQEQREQQLQLRDQEVKGNENAKLKESNSLKDEKEESMFIKPGKYFCEIDSDKLYSMNNFDVNFNQVLGTGSFGDVYVGVNRVDKKKYAIKRIDKKKFQQNGTTKENIMNEIDIQSKIAHEHIVRLYSFHETDSYFYLISELASKGTLYSSIRKSRGMDEKKGFHYFIQTASAIQFLHSIDLVHRDLKPENILIDESNNVKLCDFGWCVKLDQGPRSTFCGTYEYMAPEVIKEEPYCKSIDVWSLGVLLYEILHGYSPFRAKKARGSEMNKEIFSNITQYKYKIDKVLTNSCKDLINKLLCPDKNGRILIDDVFRHPWVEKNEREVRRLQKPEIKSRFLSSNNVVPLCSGEIIETKEKGEKIDKESPGLKPSITNVSNQTEKDKSNKSLKNIPEVNEEKTKQSTKQVIRKNSTTNPYQDMYSKITNFDKRAELIKENSTSSSKKKPSIYKKSIDEVFLEDINSKINELEKENVLVFPITTKFENNAEEKKRNDVKDAELLSSAGEKSSYKVSQSSQSSTKNDKMLNIENMIEKHLKYSSKFNIDENESQSNSVMNNKIEDFPIEEFSIFCYKDTFPNEEEVKQPCINLKDSKNLNNLMEKRLKSNDKVTFTKKEENVTIPNSKFPKQSCSKENALQKSKEISISSSILDLVVSKVKAKNSEKKIIEVKEKAQNENNEKEENDLGFRKAKTSIKREVFCEILKESPEKPKDKSEEINQEFDDHSSYESSSNSSPTLSQKRAFHFDTNLTSRQEINDFSLFNPNNNFFSTSSTSAEKSEKNSQESPDKLSYKNIIKQPNNDYFKAGILGDMKPCGAVVSQQFKSFEDEIMNKKRSYSNKELSDLKREKGFELGANRVSRIDTVNEIDDFGYKDEDNHHIHEVIFEGAFKKPQKKKKEVGMFTKLLNYINPFKKCGM